MRRTIANTLAKQRTAYIKEGGRSNPHIGEEKFQMDLMENLGYERPDDRYSWNREKQNIGLKDFSIRDLFESFVPDGRDILESWNPRNEKRLIHATMTEAGPVTTDAFSNITGQIFFTAVMDTFTLAKYMADRVTRTVPTEFQDEEKIAGISTPGDAASAIGQAQPYPEVGLSEEFVITPEKIKEGYILSLTKEDIMADRTGVLLDRANKGTEMMATNKEKRVLDTVLGVTDSYRRKNGAAQGTYGNTHTNGDFDNLSASTLIDYTDIEDALLLFDAINDPNTGEKVAIEPTQVIVPSALLLTMGSILNATQVERVDNSTAAGTLRTTFGNPVRSYETLSNALVNDRLSSTTAWFIGDFQRAFSYMENWPITTTEERENGPSNFTHDIVMRFKVSEKGVPAVIEPRYVVQGNT